METDLTKAREMIARTPQLGEFTAVEENGELHLQREGDSFARLIPATPPGWWRIEVFRHTEGWEIVDFTGTLEECLEFLTEHPNFIFWER